MQVHNVGFGIRNAIAPTDAAQLDNLLDQRGPLIADPDRVLARDITLFAAADIALGREQRQRICRSEHTSGGFCNI